MSEKVVAPYGKLSKARAEITNLENDKDNILTLREKNLKWEKVNLPDFTM